MRSIELVPKSSDPAGQSPGTADKSRSQLNPDKMLSLSAARATFVVSLGYATWRFGATDATTQMHIAIGLGISTCLALLSILLFRWKPPQPSLFILLLPAIFIGYSIFQITPFGAQSDLRLTRASQIQYDYGAQPAIQLSQISQGIGGKTPAQPTIAFSSVIPQHTKAALVPFALATVACLLASLLLNTPNSRTRFLWCVVINCSAIATWGIIQKAGGSNEILPGVANPSIAIPFAGFIYRNAGAAALLPGIAAIAALLLLRATIATASHAIRHPSSDYRTYRKPTRIYTVQELTLISLASLIVAGVAVSLSRGAWVAAGLSLLVAAISLHRHIRIGKSLVIAMILCAVVSVATAQMSSQIEARAKRINLEDVAVTGRVNHWKVGYATALDHFPFGSGLGTYGYATLLNQSSPSKVWFREAHNEYLETLVESGAVGLSLLLATIGWVLFTSSRLLRHSSIPDNRALGLFGLMALTCASVHSITDFVISVPANLFVYASFLGALAVAATNTASRPPHASAVDQRYRSAICLIFIVVLLGYGGRYSYLQKTGDQAVAASSLADLSEAVSNDAIQERLEILNKAIAKQPDRAILYRHRSLYQLAQYRLHLIETGQASGENIRWENTSPEALFATLSLLPHTPRMATIESLLASTSLKQAFSQTMDDLAQGVQHNPLFSQLHLNAAALLPIVEAEPLPWIERASTMSKSDPEKLYVCGLLSFYNNDYASLKSNWRDCLDVSQKFDKWILELGLTKLLPIEIANQIIPSSRPEMQITLVRGILTSGKQKDAIDIKEGKNVAVEIAESVIKDSRVSIERRHAVAASIYSLIDDQDAASKHWLSAVEIDPRNPNYRYEAARQLKGIGELDKALHHVVLGSSLSPADIRFPNLTAQIRSDIAKARQ